MPIPDGFVRTVPEMVISLGVKEIFPNFFANDAPYSFDYAMEMLGYEFIEKSIW